MSDMRFYDNEIIVLFMESADQYYIASKIVFMEFKGFTKKKTQL